MKKKELQAHDHTQNWIQHFKASMGLGIPRELPHFVGRYTIWGPYIGFQLS